VRLPDCGPQTRRQPQVTPAFAPSPRRSDPVSRTLIVHAPRNFRPPHRRPGLPPGVHQQQGGAFLILFSRNPLGSIFPAAAGGRSTSGMMTGTSPENRSCRPPGPAWRAPFCSNRWATPSHYVSPLASTSAFLDHQQRSLWGDAHIGLSIWHVPSKHATGRPLPLSSLVASGHCGFPVAWPSVAPASFARLHPRRP